TTLGARGVEGFVTVRFDVDTRGQTRNVTVVASSHAGFERAAIRAAEKFRYRAQIVDGQPVTTTGLHYRFRFELDDT
ncbi:MAG: energy transducer TonB, partial [Pseudomonadota bacterium]